MGINVVFKTRIKFNGKEYGSADEMPVDIRQTYEQALAAMADPGHAKGIVVHAQTSSKINFNGTEYDSAEHMPPDVRRTYEMVMAQMVMAAGAASRKGPPGAVEAKSPVALPAGGPAGVGLRSPLNRIAPGESAGRTAQGRRLIRVVLILGLLVLLAGFLLYLFYARHAPKL